MYELTLAAARREQLKAKFHNEAARREFLRNLTTLTTDAFEECLLADDEVSLLAQVIVYITNGEN